MQGHPWFPWASGLAGWLIPKLDAARDLAYSNYEQAGVDSRQPGIGSLAIAHLISFVGLPASLGLKQGQS
jgi:hypothetical protein